MKVLIIKIGSDERPAGPEDIDKAKKDWEKLAKNKGGVWISHHCVSTEYVETEGIEEVQIVGNE